MSLTACVLAILACTKQVVEFVQQLRSDKVIIGVVGRVPSELYPLKDYTSLSKAKRSSDEVVVLHCRTNSYALRHCEFVVSDVSHDEKVIDPRDHDALESLIERVGEK